MYDSLVNELQFEIDRHNLRVTVNQARKSSMQSVQTCLLDGLDETDPDWWILGDYCGCDNCDVEVKKDLGKVSLVRGLRDDPEFLGTTGPTTGDEF